MSEALYTREILRLAVSIPHEGRLKNPQGSAELRSKTCGSRVSCDVNLTPSGVIEHVGIEVHACALGQASAAILMQNAEGLRLVDIEKASERIAAFLGGEQNSPGDWKQLETFTKAREHTGRHVAISLPYDALIAACQNALQQNEKL